MNFYELWLETRKNDISTTSFFEDFLSKSNQSLTPLMEGTEIEICQIIDLLLSYPIENFINKITDVNYSIEPSMIPIFSNFTKAIHDTPIVIEASENGLTFDEIGKKIMGSKNNIAQKKYGENHSKLAAECSFVELKKFNNLTIAFITNLGKISTAIDIDTKMNLCKRLILRNEFIKKMIYNAKKSKISYFDMSSSLSLTTAVRKKSNVKFILNLILKDTKYEYLLENINWQE